MAEAWSILDELYGQAAEIRSKLKGQILALQLKATKSPEKEIELFDSIQYISSRIKAAGGRNLLEADEEYISLVAKHLSTERREEWVQTDGEDWEAFFKFLEKKAKVARKIQILENTGSGFKPPSEKKCSICSGDHYTKFCKNRKKPSL